jgi:hypothetical protein
VRSSTHRHIDAGVEAVTYSSRHRDPKSVGREQLDGRRQRYLRRVHEHVSERQQLLRVAHGRHGDGTSIAEAFLPNPTNVNGCATPSQYDNTGLSPATRSLADSTSHELMESITDKTPNGNGLAWIDNGGRELADKCEFLYGGPVSVSGRNWEVQQEWSNAVSGGVQYS